MIKYVVVLALFAGALADGIVQPAVDENEDVSRLFATRITSTYTAYSSSGSTVVTTSCAVLTNATTACRRRRGIEDVPIVLSLEDEEVKPSAVVPVEVTALPNADDPRPVRLEASEFNENGMIEIDVKNYKNCAKPGEERQLFNFITIIYTTTTTLPYSSTSTTTNKFIINGCSPSGITTCA